MEQYHKTLINIVESRVPVSPEEQELLTASFHPKSSKKNEFLLKSGQKPQQLYFIVSGYVRCFYVDDEGNEITTDILSARELVTSFESFLKDIPSSYSIQCISDCELLFISKQDYQALYQKVEGWPVFCQGVYESHILKMTSRINALQTLSASDRYEKLLNKQPEIALHTPVKHLASYLGIKPQSLSRIRKDIK
ncbi:Crp/Fnr family transcriptional regulator [Fulvivirga kasyanovii]|uniref:Crp/Fnr family transcriptional regulator n=1 Tax=Fulvivirga kasyanovii TaxID=396812 RepID=A0ABW9RTZ3_9BACT|nr:Crp/Fnr family transcriptional regulator [Fulvivirga kasyanovii]MTI27682.1 Crp/Fnr family transcriptional regulator [Fulvivirga kasyanovii]